MRPLIFLLLALTLSACQPAGRPTWALSTVSPLAPGKARIAFFSWEPGLSGPTSRDIYLVDNDGTGLARLTHTGQNGHPAWSPDGQQIAFSSESIQLVTADGHHQVRLTFQTFSPGINGTLAWSPDGREIAFASYGGDGQGQVYVIDVEKALQGSGAGSLRQVNQQGVDAQGLSWSPDGQYLTFYFKDEYHQPSNVAVLNVGNPWLAGQRTVLVSRANSPAWSPDGKQMLFVGETENRDESNIFLIQDAPAAIARGSPTFYGPDRDNFQRLTNTNMEAAPAWSPDGKQIVFTSKRDGNWEIYVMRADGSHQTRLTDNPATDDSPTWSADGGQIAFVSNRDGNQEIYVMNADGSSLKRLTSNAIDDWGPVWQP